jgi:Uma2 family endonuclease
MKVKLRSEIKKKSIFYYPDVVVSCELSTQDQFILNSPCLIIEVLSPSTEVIDKREKLQNYQNIPSLQEYVLVSQDRICIEIYRRIDEENWTRETLGREDKLQLDSVNLILPVTDIYEDVF